MPDSSFPNPSRSLGDPPSKNGKALTASEKAEEQSLRPSTPVCPRCQINLQGVKHTTGIAWRCPSCGGQSLNFSQFRRMIPGARVDDIWLTATAEPVISPLRGKCPECRRIMHAVLVPWQDQEIELDLCRPCQRLWMDNPENPRLLLGATGVSRTPRKPPVVRTGQSGRVDEVRQEFQEKLLRVRNFLDKRKEDAAGLHIVKVLLALLLLWFVLKGAWPH